MKINPLTRAAGFLRLVQSSGDGQPQRDSEEHRQKKRDESDKDDSPKRSEQEMKDAINQAVGAFTVDPQTQASGLSAETEGTGPGLRVTLKDSQGAVVRQFTGEEFLRLREAASKDTHSRGRILDQKS
jgi:uncharacterized protein YlxW (UPF0749 family)